MSNNEAHKQIEDIIDARNRSGQYDVLCNGVQNHALQQGNTRYAHSTPASPITCKIRDDVCKCNIEGGNPDFRYLDMCSTSAVGPTDSEITLIRVKREGNHIKRIKENKWDHMHDLVIPGDGSHLGESPSLVNLVTLVVPYENNAKSQNRECKEYLVPLSSWEPKQANNSPNSDNLSDEISENQCQVNSNASKSSGNSTTPENPVQSKRSVATSSSIHKHKSIPSLKQLLRRLSFWKRKSIDRIEIDKTSK